MLCLSIHLQSQEDQAEHGSFLALRSSTGLSRNLSNANDALPALCSPRISSLLLQANIVSMPSWPRGMSPSRCLGIRCQGLAGAFQFSFLGHAEFNDQYFGTRNGRVLDCVMWKKISKSAKEILRQRRTQTRYQRLNPRAFKTNAECNVHSRSVVKLA